MFSGEDETRPGHAGGTEGIFKGGGPVGLQLRRDVPGGLLRGRGGVKGSGLGTSLAVQ